MKLTCTEKYLALPVNYNAQKKSLLFYKEGELIYDVDLTLDPLEPDEIYYLNIERFKGQTLEIKTDPYCEMELVQTNDRYPAEEAYKGKYRPLVHFTAQRGWLNDPNGLLYYKGKYFMFFQYNPVGPEWANMHWGLAVSEDLIHWEERDIAFYGDELGTMFSGGGIVDSANVSGLKEGEDDPMLLYFTAAGGTSRTSREKKADFTQCLGYSTDGGKSFKKYSENPLLPTMAWGNRDPKVVYDEESGTYVMALYLSGHDYALFTSSNLIDWTRIQTLTIPNEMECPEFFPLYVDGDPAKKKWVIMGASDYYLTGSFDGKKFTPDKEESGRLNYGYGDASYAAQTWSHEPKGRRVRTSFFRMVFPGMPFGSYMSFPNELTLKSFGDEIRLCSNPVEEIEKLYTDVQTAEQVVLTPEQSYTMQVKGKAQDIQMVLSAEEDVEVLFSLYGLQMKYDGKTGSFGCLKENKFDFEKHCIVPIYNEVPAKSEDGKLHIRMIFDTLGAELYINDGSVYMGKHHTEDWTMNRLEMKVEGGNAVIDSLKTASMKAFWEK